MTEKGIIVQDASSGESVACRDAVDQDDGANNRIIQLIDSASRKFDINGSSPTRRLSITALDRGDTLNLSDLPADIESTSITMGDADSVAVAVQFTYGQVDSKIIVTPIVYDGTNSLPISILEPKSFNSVYDTDSDSAFHLTGDVIWNIDDGGSNHVDSTAISGIGAFGSLMVKPDGSKAIWNDSGLGRLVQGDLSTPYDITTYSNQSYISEPDYLHSFQINQAGTIMFGLKSSATDTIQLYNLSTAWDVSTAVDQSEDANLSQTEDISGFCVSSDGLNLYTVDSVYVNWYTMATEWDPSTLSWQSETNMYTAFPSASWSGVKINPDGTKMLLMDKNGYAIEQVSLSTPYDPSTYSDDSVPIYFGSGIESSPGSIEVAADGSQIYFYGGSLKTIHQYDLTNSSESDILITTMQTWDCHGAPKIGFHIYHDSTTKIAMDVDLFASKISKSVPGYDILGKDTSGIDGSFPVKMRYGTGDLV
jgi:hypothetical protein